MTVRGSCDHPAGADPVSPSNNLTHATQRDRWRRYGAFAASLAERVRHGASYVSAYRATTRCVKAPSRTRTAPTRGFEAEARCTAAPFWAAG